MSDAPPNRDSADPPEICIIANARAGKQVAGSGLEPLLKDHPGRFEVRRVRSGKDLEGTAARAAADGYRTVVAAGGDGTINAVANAVLSTSSALGVVPLGTFNYFARSLDIPEDAPAAVSALVGGAKRRVDIGMINERVFINNASLGVYPAILQQRERAYRKWGRSRFLAVWSVVRTLLRFQSGFRMKVTVDGTEWRMKTPSVFIACNPYQLRSVNLDGAEQIEAGRLALIAAPDSGRWQLILNFVRLGMGLAQQGREFELICGEEILVETSRRNKLIAIDGERVRMRGPFMLKLMPGALEVIVPAGPE